MLVEEKWNISFKEIARNSTESNSPSISSKFQVIVLILLEVLIVAGNTLTMLTVWRLRKHPLVVDVLIFSLSLVDVLNALTSVTIAIRMRFLILRGKDISWMLCQAQGWCIVAFEMMSVFIVSLVCFDRFTAIVKPFWHRMHLTCGRMVKLVGFVAMFSSIVASLPLLGWDAYRPVDWLAMCLFNYRSSYAIFIAFFGYFQLFFVLLSAIVIIYSLRKFSKRQRRLTARYSPKRHFVRNTEFTPMPRVRTNIERQSRRLAKIGMVVVLFFYMSWLPLVVSFEPTSVTLKQGSCFNKKSTSNGTGMDVIGRYFSFTICSLRRRSGTLTVSALNSAVSAAPLGQDTINLYSDVASSFITPGTWLLRF